MISLSKVRGGVRLNARDRRALFVGALIAAPVLAWTAVVRPYMERLDAARSALESRRALLDRELALLVSAPQLPARRAALAARVGDRREELFAGDAVTATAKLTTYVSGVAREQGLAMQTIDTHDERPVASDIRELSIDIRATGSFEALLGFLQALEIGDRLVRVRRLAIEPSTAAVGGTLAFATTINGYASSRVSAPKRQGHGRTTVASSDGDAEAEEKQ